MDELGISCLQQIRLSDSPEGRKTRDDKTIQGQNNNTEILGGHRHGLKSNKSYKRPQLEISSFQGSCKVFVMKCCENLFGCLGFIIP